MNIFQIKLKKANAMSQLSEFDEWPSWDTLSSKIVEQFQIPRDQVLLTFCNPEGHFINLTNDGELQQLYKSLYESCRYIKFVIQDSQAPDSELFLPRHPSCLTLCVCSRYLSHGQFNMVIGLEFV